MSQQGKQAPARRRSLLRGRAVQVGLPTALSIVVLVAWLAAGRPWLPLLWGLGALVVLSILRLRDRIGEGLSLAIALLLILVQVAGDVPGVTWMILLGLLLAAVNAALLLPAVRHRLPDRWTVRRRWPAMGLAAGLVVAITAGVIAAVTQHRESEQRAERDERARLEHLAKALPRTPQALLQATVESLWHNTVTDFCHDRWAWRVTDHAANQFADLYGDDDCATAVHRLHSQIDNAHYINDLAIRTDWFDPSHDYGPSVQIDACQMRWSNILDGDYGQPGPQLGHLTIERQYDRGYKIADWRPCQ